MNQDPRKLMDEEPMGRLQFIAVTLCILLYALDGFDVLSISFAAPGIADEWAIDRAALGLVLAMELLGMIAGSLLLGDIADRFGRRPLILLCLVVMSIGMWLAATADSIEPLSAYRFFTGLGIGGMLATTNAMVAEYSNRKHRSLAVTLMAAGYPLGAIAGGSVVSVLLASYDWRSVFVFGALATTAFIPLVWFFLPESVAFLCQKKPEGALQRINKTLRRMGHATVSSLPATEVQPDRTGMRELFRPEMLRITILLTLAYFAHIATFYFIIKWVPKLVVDMGFTASSAGSVLVWFNIGGMIGALTFGLLTHWVELRRLVIIVLLIASAAVIAFGQGQSSLGHLALAAAVGGFFTNAGVVGLYALLAQSYPTNVRAGGTGFSIGIGRAGAALGTVLAGFLFVAGASLAAVAAIMSIGSIVAAVAVIALGYATQNKIADVK